MAGELEKGGYLQDFPFDGKLYPYVNVLWVMAMFDSFIHTENTELRVRYIPRKKTRISWLKLKSYGQLFESYLSVSMLKQKKKKKSSLWAKFIIHFHILSYKPPSISCLRGTWGSSASERLPLRQYSSDVGIQKLWSSFFYSV